MKIVQLLFEGCYASSVTGLHDVLQIASFLSDTEGRSGAATLKCTYATETGKAVRATGGIAMAADVAIDDLAKVDLVYLPCFPYEGKQKFDLLAKTNTRLLEWLVSQWKQGAIVATSCTGTFLLAETGLLNNRKATTTWWLEHQFRKRYPLVKLDRKSVLTSDDRLMCAGAMNSYFNLAIEIVAHFTSASLATDCARAMMIDLSQQVQPYSQETLADLSNHHIVAKAQHWLQGHVRDDVTVAFLAQRLNVSTRSLARYFKDELGLSPIQYLQQLRVTQSKKLLENTKITVSQICMDVGYADVSSFTNLFKRHTGLTPAQYRKAVTSRRPPGSAL